MNPRTLQGYAQSKSRAVSSGADLDGLSPAARAMFEAVLAANIVPELTVTSGFRDPARNQRAGGADGSRHMRGDAIDLSLANLSDEQRAQLLQTAIGAGARGIGIYPNGSLHIDTRENPAFWGVGGSYRGASPDQAPAWAQAALGELFGGSMPAATQIAGGQRPPAAQAAQAQMPLNTGLPQNMPAALAAGPTPTGVSPTGTALSGLGDLMASLQSQAQQPRAVQQMPVMAQPTRNPDLASILGDPRKPLALRT
jgi:hypothetical protein